MIEGQLLPGFLVNLDDRTASHGGSWITGSSIPLQAYGQDIIGTFFNLIRNKSPLLVFDLGANTGSFCLLARFIPQMRCFAVEPVSSEHDVLCSNISLNFINHRVNALSPMALSDHNGTGTMKVPLDSACSGLSFMDDRRPWFASRQESVQVNTLDGLCEQLEIDRIDAIKIDVEHCEEKVLLGGESSIRHFRPMIMLERTLPERTVPLLKSWGYKITDYGTDLLARI